MRITKLLPLILLVAIAQAHRGALPFFVQDALAADATSPDASASSAEPPSAGTLDDLAQAARTLKSGIEAHGLTAANVASASALAKRLEEAGHGYFPGAGDLSAAARTSKAADALDALSWIAKTLDAARARAPRGGSPDVQSDREALKAILASTGYKLKPPDWSWADVIWAKIIRFLRWLIDVIPSPGSGMAAVATVFLIIVLCLICAAALFLALREYGRHRDRRRAHEPDGEPVDGFAIDSPDAHRNNALELLARGEYRLALRQVFLVLLSELERMKLVTYDRSRTNVEYAREFSRRVKDDDTSAVMRSIVRAYDNKWYGGSACTGADVSELDSKVTALTERARRSPRQA